MNHSCCCFSCQVAQLQGNAWKTRLSHWACVICAVIVVQIQRNYIIFILFINLLFNFLIILCSCPQ